MPALVAVIPYAEWIQEEHDADPCYVGSNQGISFAERYATHARGKMKVDFGEALPGPDH